MAPAKTAEIVRIKEKIAAGEATDAATIARLDRLEDRVTGVGTELARFRGEVAKSHEATEKILTKISETQEAQGQHIAALVGALGGGQKKSGGEEKSGPVTPQTISAALARNKGATGATGGGLLTLVVFVIGKAQGWW